MIYLTAHIPLEDIDLDTRAKTIEPMILPFGLGTMILHTTLCLN